MGPRAGPRACELHSLLLRPWASEGGRSWENLLRRMELTMIAEHKQKFMTIKFLRQHLDGLASECRMRGQLDTAQIMGMVGHIVDYLEFISSTEPAPRDKDPSSDPL